MSAERVSAVGRLRSLRALFSLRDVTMRHGMSPDTARNAISRWKANRLVAPAGPKLGWYYNLIVDPDGRDAHLGDAITAVFGTAVVIGATVLNDRGWTPQRPMATMVAVPQARSYPKIDGALVYGRPAEWYLRVHAAINCEFGRAGPGRFGLPSLPPEFALADMLKHRDCLHSLAPDDIEIPDDEMQPDVLAEAFETLGVPPDCYGPYTRGCLPAAASA